MIYANPIVGRTGLCNMLVPWARAEVFAKKTGAKILAPRWTNYFRIGHLLRNERNRYYLNEFTNKGYVSGLERLAAIAWRKHVAEGAFSSGMDSIVVDFRGMDGFMEPFFGEHDYILGRLRSIADPGILKRAESLSQNAYIGVHVRRGDFCSTRLAIKDKWYVEAICETRKRVGNLPVWVFSDAPPRQLWGITSNFDDITIMPKMPALQDLLVLSNAKMIVGTSRSSFSYWAIYLGQSPSILHTVYSEKPDPLYLDGKKPILL